MVRLAELLTSDRSRAEGLAQAGYTQAYAACAAVAGIITGARWHVRWFPPSAGPRRRWASRRLRQLR